MNWKKITLLALIASACTNRSDVNVATFQIKTDTTTNGGTPFYVLVKETDYMDYVCDDYNKIYGELATSKDESLALKTFYVIPGETKIVRVEAKENRHPAIYFLFTEPGEAWSYFASGGGKQTVKLQLGEHEIEAQSSFRK